MPQPQIEADELLLLERLGYEPADMDSLISDGSFSVAELARLLVALEIKGLIESQNGLYQRLR
jgi:predicted Rossmann fold nucleotide-binding protein DprA/Smf involved in DNA uptake